MHNEVELKAVLADPGTARMRLLSVGAVVRFRGAMSDRRYDRNGELAARDEVLRLRTFRDADGRSSAVIGWKGAARRSPEGYKERDEIELAVGEARGAPAAFLTALGYQAVQDIDRWVEVFELGGAVVRLESYPRMDDLVEVEGDPAAIERAVAVLGIPRSEFTAEPLAEFTRRYELRTGAPAVLASSATAHAPGWAAS
jgi:adenylate cyclase class IV